MKSVPAHNGSFRYLLIQIKAGSIPIMEILKIPCLFPDLYCQPLNSHIREPSPYISVHEAQSAFHCWLLSLPGR